ncbi:MAG: DNA primase DnaG [Candidatus Altarchaeaceae archaeon]
MAKAPADTIKYVITGEIEVDGIVEKPDVVGAIFGQAEGLLGEDLELRDLQKTGRIGRIDVELTTKLGKSYGKVIIPSSLDMVETAIVAAAVEMVDRVGPCAAKIKIVNVEDTRATKRKAIIDRAKEILKKLVLEQIPESMDIENEVRQLVQMSEVQNYKGLPAGPDVEKSDEIIIVEGRADVLNLLKADIKNVIAVEGTNISDVIVDLVKRKTAIAFFDGDRGGDILLNELLQKTEGEIDYVARAPKGKEVEELTKKEIIMTLRKKIPVSQLHIYKKEEEPTEKTQELEINEEEEKIKREEEEKRKNEDMLLKVLGEIKGKLIAKLFDKNLKQISEIEIKDLLATIQTVKPFAIVFDGIVTQRLIDIAAMSNVSYIVGINTAKITDEKNIRILTEKG